MDKLTASQLDSILNFLDKSQSGFDRWSDIFDSLQFDYDKYNLTYLSILKTNNYINTIDFEGDTPPYAQITEFGRAFIHTTSFFDKIENDTISKAKAKFDLKQTKRQYYLFWIITPIAVIGGFIGIISGITIWTSKSQHLPYSQKQVDSIISNRVDSIFALRYKTKATDDSNKIIVDSFSYKKGLNIRQIIN